MAFVTKPPSVTRNVAGSVLNMSDDSANDTFSPNESPTLKHPLMKPARRAMTIPLGKLKSLTAAFFSSSESDCAFMFPAMPITAMPASVTTTPIITEAVSWSRYPMPGYITLSMTGPSIVPRPAHVPKAIDWPRATPR